MFGLSILISSILSIATPAAILSSYGLSAGLAVRALLGLGASGTFPAAFYFYPEVCACDIYHLLCIIYECLGVIVLSTICID